MKIRPTDIDPTGGSNDQVLGLVSGVPTWIDQTGGGGGGGAAFSGAYVYASGASFSQGSGTADVTAFNTEDFDVGNWYDPATPGYFTVPSGVEYVVATLKIVDADNIAGQLIPIIMLANSAGVDIGIIAQTEVESTGGDTCTVSSGVVKVTPGQRIKAQTFLTNVRTLDGGKYGCYFSIRAVSVSGGSSGPRMLSYLAADPLVNSTVLFPNQVLVTYAVCESATPITGLVLPSRAIPAGQQVEPVIYNGGVFDGVTIQPNAATLVATGPAISPVANVYNKVPLSSPFTPVVGNVYYVGFNFYGASVNFNLMSGYARRAWWRTGTFNPPPDPFGTPTSNASENYAGWFTY